MEEDKKIIGSEQTTIQEADNTNSFLPGAGIQYSKDSKTESEIKTSLLPGRINNALSESIIATSRSIEKKYGLTIKDTIIKDVVDAKGRIPKPSAMQKRVLLSLGYRLSLLMEEPEIKGYIEKLKDKKNPSDNVKVFISLEDMCGDIHGEEEKWIPGKQNRIKQELKDISETKRLHIYKTELQDENGRTQEVLVEDFYPYINLTGRERRVSIGKRTALAVEVEFTRIFFERAWDRYYQLLPSFWEAEGLNGRRMITDTYWSLSTLVMNKAWSHYHHDLPEAENYIKEQGILDPDKIKQIKEKALTHTPTPFEELKAIQEKSSEHPQQKARFKEYLLEAMWALIKRNILSEESSIDWENETFTLVYSEAPNIPRDKEPGGRWDKNVIDKKRTKKS